MKGAFLISCFAIMVAFLLVSQARTELEWNLNEDDENDLNSIEMQKRSKNLERQKRLCGVFSRRRHRCRSGVSIELVFIS